jgi:hypothetical protein
MAVKREIGRANAGLRRGLSRFLLSVLLCRSWKIDSAMVLFGRILAPAERSQWKMENS